MKKTLFLWLIIFFTPFFIKAQDDEYQAPNYDTIQKMMAENPALYPTIEARFLRADFSLTEEEINIFYYGKVFRDDYSPYHNVEWTDNIKQIMYSGNLKKSLLKKELKNINKAIADYPATLEGHMIKYIICLGLFGEESDEAQTVMYQLISLVKAIASTGDGQSMESAFYVTHVSDEHTIMNMMGWGWKEQELHQNAAEGQYYDCFWLKENEEEQEVLYFNITPCFKALSAELGEVSSSENEFSNRIEIPLGTRVTLRLKEGEKGTFQAAVIDKKPFSGEVDEATFSSENDPDIVELIFIQTKTDGNREQVVLCAKSFNDKALSFDSSIQYRGKKDFESTSNVGWFPKALMREQWYPGIVKIRLENIRIMEL